MCINYIVDNMILSFIPEGTEVVARRRNALSSFISKETEVGNEAEGTHLFKGDVMNALNIQKNNTYQV